MVEGRILMRGRRVLFVDDDRFISRAQQLLARASFAIGPRWPVLSAAASARR
jgi:hypothetical protein